MWAGQSGSTMFHPPFGGCTIPVLRCKLAGLTLRAGDAVSPPSCCRDVLLGAVDLGILRGLKRLNLAHHLTASRKCYDHWHSIMHESGPSVLRSCDLWMVSYRFPKLIWSPEHILSQPWFPILRSGPFFEVKARELWSSSADVSEAPTRVMVHHEIMAVEPYETMNTDEHGTIQHGDISIYFMFMADLLSSRCTWWFLGIYGCIDAVLADDLAGFMGGNGIFNG